MHSDFSNYLKSLRRSNMNSARRPIIWSLVALSAVFFVNTVARAQIAPAGIPVVAKDVFSAGSDLEMTELNQVVYEQGCSGQAAEYKTKSSSRLTDVTIQVNKIKKVNGDRVKRIRIINLTTGATEVFKNKDLGDNKLNLTLNDPKNGFSLAEGKNEIEIQLLGKKVKDPVTKVRERVILYTEIQVINVTKTVKDLPATTQNVCTYTGYRYWRYSDYHYYWHSHAWYSYRYHRRWDWYSPYSPYHWRITYRHRSRNHWYPGWRTRHAPRVVVRKRHGGLSNPGTGRSRNGTRVTVPPRRRGPVTGPINRRPIPTTRPTRPVRPRSGGVSNPRSGVGSNGNTGTTRPSRPTTRPSTPTTRPSTPSTRPSRPTTRPSTPTTRPSTPSTRPSRPSRPSSGSTSRPSRPSRPSTPVSRPSRPSRPSGGSTSRPSRPSRPSGGSSSSSSSRPSRPSGGSSSRPSRPRKRN
jgi:hypothetical protein